MSFKSINHSTREGRQAERRFWPWETQGYKKAEYHSTQCRSSVGPVRTDCGSWQKEELPGWGLEQTSFFNISAVSTNSWEFYVSLKDVPKHLGGFRAPGEDLAWWETRECHQSLPEFCLVRRSSKMRRAMGSWIILFCHDPESSRCAHLSERSGLSTGHPFPYTNMASWGGPTSQVFLCCPEHTGSEAGTLAGEEEVFPLSPHVCTDPSSSAGCPDSLRLKKVTLGKTVHWASQGDRIPLPVLLY